MSDMRSRRDLLPQRLRGFEVSLGLNSTDLAENDGLLAVHINGKEEGFILYSYEAGLNAMNKTNKLAAYRMEEICNHVAKRN